MSPQDQANLITFGVAALKFSRPKPVTVLGYSDRQGSELLPRYYRFPLLTVLKEDIISKTGTMCDSELHGRMLPNL